MRRVAYASVLWVFGGGPATAADSPQRGAVVQRDCVLQDVPSASRDAEVQASEARMLAEASTSGYVQTQGPLPGYNLLPYVSFGQPTNDGSHREFVELIERNHFGHVEALARLWEQNGSATVLYKAGVTSFILINVANVAPAEVHSVSDRLVDGHIDNCPFVLNTFRDEQGAFVDYFVWGRAGTIVTVLHGRSGGSPVNRNGIIALARRAQSGAPGGSGGLRKNVSAGPDSTEAAAN